ncbi:MAG: hypothetical protein AVDCRST_MAG45-1723, partial [uncultured Solirubrobacterales bacterium]
GPGLRPPRLGPLRAQHRPAARPGTGPAHPGGRTYGVRRRPRPLRPRAGGQPAVGASEAATQAL